MHRRRAVLVTTAISQPRHQRRAHMLHDAGLRVRVYGFSRGYYPDNTYAPGIEVFHLGTLKAGRYVDRLRHLLKAALKIRKTEAQEASPPALQYAFGLDSALITSLAIHRSVPFIYEVGDLMNPEPSSSLQSRLIHALEKGILARATRLVVTAPAFLTDFYAPMGCAATENAVVIENKLPSSYRSIAERPPEMSVHQPIRLGFIGAFRYEHSLLPIVEAVSKRVGKFEMHLYGDGPLRGVLQEFAEVESNIFYHGAFKNPDDLEKIYKSIDLNCVVYDNRDRNVRLALPNKLYESIYFGKPVLVAAQTHLARRVRELGIGFEVEPRNDCFMESFLDALQPDDLMRCSANALALSETLALQNEDEVVSSLLDQLW